MKNAPKIKRDHIKTLLETRFIKVYDLQYEEGKHYYEATRRNAEKLMAVQTDEDFRKMLPDAVSCAVILKVNRQEPKLLLSYEYRYPAGRFLLSIPAGLLDPGDASGADPILTAAKREIWEETGLELKETDRIFTVNRLLFSTPGMTDESNALVCAVAERDEPFNPTSDGIEGTECFDGFLTVTPAEAREILKRGTDANGNPFSMYTWAALMIFTTRLWEG